MIELKEPFLTLWHNKDPFQEIAQLNGVIFRQVAERKTVQFELAGKSYFIKIHVGTTLKEIIKNWLTLRCPILDASHEWKAINHLSQYQINTMKSVAFAIQGINPLTRKSFIITEDLNPTLSLEELTASWKINPPKPSFKKKLIRTLALTVRKMHQIGVNHRDCYLCHFLLHKNRHDHDKDIKISIIDLHRAQIRRKIPLRWRNKDLIGLYFSSLNIGLNHRDYFLFMKVYFNRPLSSIFKHERRFLDSVARKAEKIRQRTLLKQL